MESPIDNIYARYSKCMEIENSTADNNHDAKQAGK